MRGLQGSQLRKDRQVTGPTPYSHQHRPDQNAVGRVDIETAETAFAGRKIVIRPPAWTINGWRRAKPSEFVQLDQQTCAGLAGRLFTQGQLDSRPGILSEEFLHCPFSANAEPQRPLLCCNFLFEKAGINRGTYRLRQSDPERFIGCQKFRDRHLVGLEQGRC